jgi:ABC-type Fe3+-siderophore transport system permease subunit
MIILQGVYVFSPDPNPMVFAWLILISYLLMLKFLRAFKTTRVFIQLLVTSFYSTRQFLIVLVVVVLAFTQAFFVASSKELTDTPMSKWHDWLGFLRDQFLSTVEDPEAEWFKEEYVWPFYWLRTIIILVVMMTLLIAVVVSNYEVVARSMDQQ